MKHSLRPSNVCLVLGICILRLRILFLQVLNLQNFNYGMGLLLIMSGEQDKMGVISFHNSKETKSLLNCAEELGFDPVWIMEENLRMKMSKNGLNVQPDSDVLVNRMLLSKSPQPVQLLGLSQALSSETPILNPPKNVLASLNKITATSIISSLDDCDVPETYFGDEEEIRDLIESEGEVIQKRAVGTHGNSVSLINDEDAAISNALDHYSITQEQVDQEGSSRDVRAYVVGDEIVSCMERVSSDDEWRTNIAKGAEARQITLDDELENKVLKVCRRFNLDYAGVDLMVGSDDVPYFLEINPTAGFKGLFDATGVNPAPYIIGQAAKKIGHDVDREEIERLSKSLDDSVPECRPPLSITESPRIGLEVQSYVSGVKKQRRIESKVDTGATRTSIDIELASELGLGPIKDYTVVRSANSKETKKRPVVKCTIKIKGITHDVNVSLEDRDHMTYDLILGRDILQHYTIQPNLSDVNEDGPEE